MANKPLKSIKFPGLPDTYTVPQIDNTLTHSGQAADAGIIGSVLGEIGEIAGRLTLGWSHGGMYYATGIEFPDGGTFCTGFIKITPGETIKIYNPTEKFINVFQFENNSTTTSGNNERVFVSSKGTGFNFVNIRSNVNYIRLQIPGHDISETNGVFVYTTNNVLMTDCKSLFEAPINSTKAVTEKELFVKETITGVTFELGTIEQGNSTPATIRARTNGHVDLTKYDAVEIICDPAIEYRVLLYTEKSAVGFDGIVNAWGEQAGVVYKTNHVSVRLIFRVKESPNIDISNDNLALIQQTVINGLVSKVSAVEEQIPAIYSIDDVVPQDFVIGSILQNGWRTAATNRVITSFIQINGSNVSVNIADGYECRIAEYENNTASSFIGFVNSWEEKKIVYAISGKYIRLLIRFTSDPDADISQEQLNYVAENTNLTDKLVLDDVRTLLDEYISSVKTVATPYVERDVRYFKIGGLSPTGGNDTSTNRVRTSVYYETTGITRVQSNNPSILFRVAVYGAKTYESFESYLNTYTSKPIELPQGKYIRVVAKYANDGDITNIDDFREAVVFIYEKNDNQYQSLVGKTVAIFGDSISTTGTEGPDDDESNVPELIIAPEDVGKTLKATLTYRDFRPYGSGHNTDDTEPLPVTVGGVTYTYDAETRYPSGTEITFVPTSDDIGKKIGQVDNRNPDGMKVWWQIAAEQLGFKVVNATYSGSCICRARNVPNDWDDYRNYPGTYAWNDSQIRRCGKRIKGTMNRISPDVIIIYRGTNDFGSLINGKAPAIDMDIFEQNAEITITDDSAGIAPARNETETDKEYYSFVNGYFLTVHKLQKAYPRAKIFLCTIQDIRRRTWQTYPIRCPSGTLSQWNECIRTIARYMGCGIIDFARDGINFFNYADYVYDPIEHDGVHPGEEGQRIMGNRAIADLKAQYSSMDITSVEDVLNSGASQDVKNTYIWSGEFS